jgi:hypothetical protein
VEAWTPLEKYEKEKAPVAAQNVGGMSQAAMASPGRVDEENVAPVAAEKTAEASPVLTDASPPFKKIYGTGKTPVVTWRALEMSIAMAVTQSLRLC